MFQLYYRKLKGVVINEKNSIFIQEKHFIGVHYE